MINLVLHLLDTKTLLLSLELACCEDICSTSFGKLYDKFYKSNVQVLNVLLSLIKKLLFQRLKCDIR